MSSEALAAIRRNPLFSVIPPGHLPAILECGDPVELAEGEMLFRQGDDARRLYVLLSGAVELVVERPGHPPEVLARLGPDETVGADALTPGGRHAATARVIEAATAAKIDAAGLIAYLDGNFDLTLASIAMMAGSLRGLIKEITELKLQSTTERLASYLAELSGMEEGRAVVHLPFEKRLLADRLGMEPATLSRAFGKLRELGVETGRGDKVVIGDVAVLRELGEAVELLHEGGLA